jgi:hypothetical protein
MQVTGICLARAKSYFGRFMHLPYKHQKAYYKMPRFATMKNPIANKTPEEYGDTWDQRTGLEWYRKLRHRGIYAHWPWARWTDDPIRHHRIEANNRTFSLLLAGSNNGAPEWNYYEEVGEDYGVPAHYPLEAMEPFISTYANKAWPRGQIKGFLRALQKEFATIAELSAGVDQARMWNERSNAVPVSFFQHAVYLSQDIAALEKKKEYRRKEHERGVLRTRTMQRYYALPYLVGPAMPTTLEQPSGVYYEGLFNRMAGGTDIHPQFKLDGVKTHAFYP